MAEFAFEALGVALVLRRDVPVVAKGAVVHVAQITAVVKEGHS